MNRIASTMAIVLISLFLASHALSQVPIDSAGKGNLGISSNPKEVMVEIVESGFKKPKTGHELIIKDIQSRNYHIRVSNGKKLLEYEFSIHPGTESHLMFDLKNKKVSVSYVAEMNRNAVINSEMNSSTAEIIDAVEEQPSFPGGEDARIAFLRENLRYPERAKRMGIQGKVFVTFSVETDGSLTGIRVLRGLGGGCDEEAVRLIQIMPKWKSGIQRGVPVKVQFNLPISFRP